MAKTKIIGRLLTAEESHTFAEAIRAEAKAHLLLDVEGRIERNLAKWSIPEALFEGDTLELTITFRVQMTEKILSQLAELAGIELPRIVEIDGE